MTEKRNTDWTDKLRERLSDSELSPSADIWSKVDSAAASSRKTVPAAAWWGFAFAAAALTVLLFIPKGGNVVEVASEPQQTMLAEVVTEVEEDEFAEPVTPAVARKPAGLLADAVASTVPGNPVEQAVADTPATPSATEASATPAVADSPTTETAQPSEYGFGTLPEEIVKPRKKVGVHLFASGIPGNSGLISRPDLYFVHDGISSDNTRGGGLPVISSYGNNAVVVNDYNGLISRNLGLGTTFENGYRIDDIEEYFLLLGHELRHHRPISVGVSLSYPLARNVFLESGLSYTFLRSEYAGGLGDQRLHFLGIPLKLGYRFNTPSNFSVALSAGAMAEKCIYGELFGSRIAVKEPLFSAVATASLYYSLEQNLSLFVAPDLSYYFTRTSVPTYRTERPLSMTLRLGVNVNIDR